MITAKACLSCLRRQTVNSSTAPACSPSACGWPDNTSQGSVTDFWSFSSLAQESRAWTNCQQPLAATAGNSSDPKFPIYTVRTGEGGNIHPALIILLTQENKKSIGLTFTFNSLDWGISKTDLGLWGSLKTTCCSPVSSFCTLLSDGPGWVFSWKPCSRAGCFLFSPCPRKEDSFSGLPWAPPSPSILEMSLPHMTPDTGVTFFSFPGKLESRPAPSCVSACCCCTSLALLLCLGDELRAGPALGSTDTFIPGSDFTASTRFSFCKDRLS